MNGHMPEIHFCGDFVMRRGWKLESVSLKEHELVYFPRGTGTVYRRGDQVYLLDQPCFILAKTGDVHSYHFCDQVPTRHLFANFSGGELAAPDLFRPNGPDRIVSEEGSYLTVTFSHLLEVAHKEKEPYRCNVLLTSLLSELQAAYWRDVKPIKPADLSLSHPGFLNEAIRYLQQHLTEPVSIAELAAHCRISREHLARTFNRVLGISPRQMIIQLRLERAAHMLRHSTLSIKEIALRCGFVENYYFSRMFSAHYGQPASVYRKKHADPRSQNIENEQFESNHPINVYATFETQ